MRRIVLLLALGTALLTHGALPARAGAEIEAGASSAADEVQAAHREKDGARLAVLARRDDPDPWIVAQELADRGEGAAAEAFALAAPRVEVKRLPAYLVARRGKPLDRTMRAARKGAALAVERGDIEAAVHNLSGFTGPVEAVEPALVAIERGDLLLRLRRYEEAEAAFSKAADGAARLGWPAFESRALASAARSIAGRGDLRGALAYEERRLTVEQGRGRPDLAAAALVAVGLAHGAMGDAAGEIEFQRRALALREGIQDGAGAAECRICMGNAQAELGKYDASLELLGLARAWARAASDPLELGRAALSLADVQVQLGELEEARESFQEAVLAFSRPSRDSARGRAFLGMAATCRDQRDLWCALWAIERASVALEVAQDRAGLADAARVRASIEVLKGRGVEAQKDLEQAIASARDLKDREVLSRARVELGILLRSQGMVEQARTTLEAGLADARTAGRDATAAVALGLLADLAEPGADPAKVAARRREAADLSLRAGSRFAGVLSHAATATDHEVAGRHDMAVAEARRGIEELMAAGPGEGEVGEATVPGRFDALWSLGTSAALRRGKTEEAAWFLEAAREVRLLEALGGRPALALRKAAAASLAAESRARRDEAEARARVALAARAADSAALKARLGEWETARARSREAGEKVRRDPAAPAGSLGTTIATLADVRGSLAEGEAWVAYDAQGPEAFAIVATSKEARVVSLGQSATLCAACAPFTGAGTPQPTAGELEALARLLITPLGLGGATRRVAVSPQGLLCVVPVALLMPDREISYAISGSRLVASVKGRIEAGEGVLAAGDEDVRNEVEALGDVRIFFRESTRSEQLDTARSRRWRAVDIACPTVLDPDRADAFRITFDTDGKPISRSVLRDAAGADVGADVLILSRAKRPAPGDVHRGTAFPAVVGALHEGGASRVLLPLWEPDPESRLALLAAFVTKVKAGTPPARALSEAQAAARTAGDPKAAMSAACWVLYGP